MNRGRTELDTGDEARRYPLREICELCAMRADFVVEMVDAGVVEAHGRGPGEWQFELRALVRLKKAARLRRDLGINLEGVALALDLLDDLEHMRHRTRTLEQRLAQLLGS